MFNLRLVKRPDGHRAVYAPNSGGVRVVTFGATLVQEIANAAEAAIKGLSPNDRNAV